MSITRNSFLPEYKPTGNIKADIRKVLELVEKELDYVRGKVPDLVLEGGRYTIEVPKGAIVMWSGKLSDVPRGWRLCDGTNGTPNLLDRFIMSVGADEDPGATGGSNTHTHTDHSYTPSGTNSAPAFTGTPATLAHAGGAVANNVITTTVQSGAGASVAAANHGHGFTQPDDHNYTPAGSVEAPVFTGNAATLTHSTENNVPVYFKLAFIMKM
jgi:hypothetical protein